MLYIPALWYFDISVKCPHRFRRIKFVIKLHVLYSSNISEILLSNRQLPAIMYELIYTLFRLLTSRGKIIVKRDYCETNRFESRTQGRRKIKRACEIKLAMFVTQQTHLTNLIMHWTNIPQCIIL